MGILNIRIFNPPPSNLIKNGVTLNRDPLAYYEFSSYGDAAVMDPRPMEKDKEREKAWKDAEINWISDLFEFLGYVLLS